MGRTCPVFLPNREKEGKVAGSIHATHWGWKPPGSNPNLAGGQAQYESSSAYSSVSWLSVYQSLEPPDFQQKLPIIKKTAKKVKGRMPEQNGGEEMDLVKTLTMPSMETTIELETAEEEWDLETPVENLSWEQLKKFLAKEIVRAVKVACNNLIESYHKEGLEKNKEGNDCLIVQGNPKKLEYLEDKTKEPFKTYLGIEEKKEQETTKDETSTTKESRIQPSDKKAAKRLNGKKNRRRKGKEGGKNLLKGLKRRKGRKEALVKVGKMDLEIEMY
ncbi:UNVERIFIED_CONTAM: hypothetical protein K2H54_057746 [Gekko kuhli]